jgi:pyruvate-formate lyase-activating enzyme
MGVYHITYALELSEVCLYFNGGCNFSCSGCITDSFPLDCHLDRKEAAQTINRTLSMEKAVFCLKGMPFKKAIFLGKEPTQDVDFLPLAKTLKENFFTYNILITNGWEYVEDKAIDEVCVSIKAITPQVFEDFTGKDNPAQVLNNFKKYAQISNVKVRAESIFIPGYIDNKEIEKITKFISSVDTTIPYRIDGYIPYSEKDRFGRPTKREMEEAKLVAEKYLQNVSMLHFGTKVKYSVKRIY